MRAATTFDTVIDTTRSVSKTLNQPKTEVHTGKPSDRGRSKNKGDDNSASGKPSSFP